MKSLELFAGLGGLAEGFSQAGFKHVGLLEFDKNACMSLRKNFPAHTVRECDVSKFDFSVVSNVDIVTGGPPCQPFSLAGKHLAENDKRDMFPYAIEAIRDKQPAAFLFENVKGLLRPSFSEYFEYIIKRLKYADTFDGINNDWRDNLKSLRKHEASEAPISYHVSFKLLNAANYGVPQLRERVIIVGLRADKFYEDKWTWPQETHSRDSLLWSLYVTEEYWCRHAISHTNSAEEDSIAEGLKAKYGFISPFEKPWVTLRDAISSLPDPSTNGAPHDHKLQPGAKPYPGHTGSILDWPSKTLKAGAHGVPGGENSMITDTGYFRYLTVHEAKLVQTFPKEYIIEGSWTECMRQIGNAVPVTLARIVADNLHSCLKGG